MSLGRDKKAMSLRGERQTARNIGGRLQPASGATPFAKADVRSDELLVERRDTASASYRLHVADLNKLAGQANADNREGVFAVGFPGNFEFAIIPFYRFMELYKGER